MTGGESATQYGEDEIDPGSAVLPDMFLDTTGHFLYILTTDRVCINLNLFMVLYFIDC